MATVIQAACRGFVSFTKYIPAFNEWLIFIRPWGYLNRESVDRESEIYSFLATEEWAIGQNVQFDIIAGNFAPQAANPVQVDGF